ncbi:hypothetical protein HZH68_000405 [Vespula germanica]|uniref:Uncharacterized protein n=1 Tax=Vespula germanica TaxID=30212 RepID=A0A834U604_VESGE|nr:hypothetical protein HZH68_000405 [Vespula germanica]
MEDVGVLMAVESNQEFAILSICISGQVEIPKTTTSFYEMLLLLLLLLRLPSDSDTLGSSFLRLLHLGEHARSRDLLTRLNVSSLWDIGVWSELWRILASRRPQPAKAAARGASLALSQRGSLKDPKRFANLARPTKFD